MKLLTLSITELQVHAFKSPKLAHCNALLYGLPHSTSKLPLLDSSPLQERMIILYPSTSIITHKALNNLAPLNIWDMLTPYTPLVRNLFILSHNLKTYGARCFSVAALTM
ncbi:hypothetical protein pdam_00022984 [Pocillopora damicornis]|uniref:Uncharacterized protein n=1 Tax=Pocillopora damicornis TaxID=46731 RepID=A0A3M6TRQ2_POCDA|nr:hypothetical protein pdam_00022984 [Pocillopora damicornis]